MLVHLSKRMLTHASALSLIQFFNEMKRTEQLLCLISERCFPCFRKNDAQSVGGECV